MLAAAALLIAVAFLRVLFAGVRRSEASLALVLALPALRRSRQARAVMPGYLVAVPSRAGELSLIACHGEAPREGEIIEDPDLAPGQFVVVRVGRSPLPRDARPCAFLQTV
jgi:hypothetical protein